MHTYTSEKDLKRRGLVIAVINYHKQFKKNLVKEINTRFENNKL